MYKVTSNRRKPESNSIQKGSITQKEKSHTLTLYSIPMQLHTTCLLSRCKHGNTVKGFLDIYKSI